MFLCFLCEKRGSGVVISLMRVGYGRDGAGGGALVQLAFAVRVVSRHGCATSTESRRNIKHMEVLTRACTLIVQYSNVNTTTSVKEYKS